MRFIPTTQAGDAALPSGWWDMRRGLLITVALMAAAGVPLFSSGQAPPAEPAAVTVMTFNIRTAFAFDAEENQWENRRDRVIQVLRDHAADFYGLQEAMLFQVDEIADAMPEYDYIARS